MHDSFLLFWDIRNPKLLGGYWNTFGDDVTSIKFHPTNPDMLVMVNCKFTLVNQTGTLKVLSEIKGNRWCRQYCEYL